MIEINYFLLSAHLKKSFIFLCFYTEFYFSLYYYALFELEFVIDYQKLDTVFFALCIKDDFLGEIYSVSGFFIYYPLSMFFKSIFIPFFVKLVSLFIFTSILFVSCSKLNLLGVLSDFFASSGRTKLFKNFRRSSEVGLLSIFFSRVIVRKFSS